MELKKQLSALKQEQEAAFQATGAGAGGVGAAAQEGNGVGHQEHQRQQQQQPQGGYPKAAGAEAATQAQLLEVEVQLQSVKQQVRLWLMAGLLRCVSHDEVQMALQMRVGPMSASFLQCVAQRCKTSRPCGLLVCQAQALCLSANR